MKLRLAIGVAAGAALIATGVFAVPGGAVTAADCTRASALEAGKPYAFDPSRPSVALVACGAFLGPGSEAMVVTFGAPTCWPVQSWAVFGSRGGSWRLVKGIPAYLVPPLVVVGNSIRETTAVHRPGDARCLPSGGTRARTWSWTGTQLAAGPWKQVKPGAPAAPAGAFRSGHFKTPSGNIVCFHSPGPSDLPRAFLGCGVKSGLKPAPPRRPCREGGYAGDRVELLATGRTHVPACAGDPGALVGLRTARVLGYGKSWSGGGISCTSAVAGLTCRNKSGHGFFLSRARWRSF
jgi:hypothetical protein